MNNIAAEEGEVIDPNGDLILVVKNNYKLLVNSAALISSSKVFANLLTWRFREGQVKRSAEHPQTIDLPDDAPHAIADLCKLLHNLTPSHLVGQVNETDLFEIVVAIDKYDCVERLRLPLHGMAAAILFYGQKPAATATLDYLLRDHSIFHMGTQFMILEYNTTVHIESRTSSSWAQSYLLPKTVFDAIEHKQVKAREAISYELPQLCMSSHAIDCETCREQGASTVQMCKAFGTPYWPGKRWAIKYAIDKIQSMAFADLIVCPHQGERPRKIGASAMQGLVNRLIHICLGLCVECVEEGSNLLETCTHTSRV